MSLTLRVSEATLFFMNSNFRAASTPPVGREYPWALPLTVGPHPLPPPLLALPPGGNTVLEVKSPVSCRVKFFGSLKVLLILPNQLQVCPTVGIANVPVSMVLIFEVKILMLLVISHQLVMLLRPMS